MNLMSPDGAPFGPPVATLERMPPRRLHPLSPLSTAALAAVRAWPIWLIALTRREGLIFVAVGAGLVVWRFLVWLRSTYEIDADGLVVRSGLLWRRVQSVPPQRIQQVDQRRALRHQVLGLVELRLGLAGTGDGNEVSLDSLSQQDAARLSEVLERWRDQGRSSSAESDDAQAPHGLSTAAFPPPEHTLFSVSTAQLVVAGLTSRSLWLAPLAALVAVFQVLGDLGLADESQDTLQTAVSRVSPAVVIVALIAVASLAAAALSVLNHFGLAVTRSGDEISIRRGLLEVRRVVVRLERVQVIQMGTNPLRRALGLATLDVRTADLGGDIGGGLHSMSIPIGERAAVESLAAVLLGAGRPLVAPPVTERHPRAAARRAVVRRLAVIAPVAAAVGAVTLGSTGLVVGGAIGALLALALGRAHGRSLRTGLNEHLVVTERGVLAWRRWSVPLDRVQSVGIVSTPFQRRRGLVTLRLDAAGTQAGVQIPDLDVARALAIVAATGVCSDPAAIEPVAAGAMGTERPSV